MKLSISVVSSLSLAVALAFGIYLTHRAGDRPPSVTMSAHVPQPAPGADAPLQRALSDEEAEAPILRTSSDEETGASSAVAGNYRPAEMHHEEMAALRAEVASLRAEVSALQRWTRTQWQTATVMAPGRADNSTKDPRTDSIAHVEVEKERQKQMEVVEANFRQEAADARWSLEAEGVVQAALTSDEIVQNTLLDLDALPDLQGGTGRRRYR